jgi:hypothetical protein
MSQSMYGDDSGLVKPARINLISVLDPSLSMRTRGLLKPAIAEHNRLLRALKDADNHHSINVLVSGLTKRVTPDFVPLDSLKELTEADFPAESTSPIADRIGEILDDVEATLYPEGRKRVFKDEKGRPARVRFFLVVVTDGLDLMRAEDNCVVRASQRYKPWDVEKKLNRFLLGDNRAIGLSIGDGEVGLQVEAMLGTMGFRRENIIRSDTSEHSIRVAFQEITRRSLVGIKRA